MRMSRRSFAIGAGAVPAALLLPNGAFAAWPEKPIHLIVPFAAGGNADIVGRIAAEEIRKAVGQPVVVENRGGAGGGVGAEAVSRADPDGYTLLVGSNGPLTVNPFVNPNLKYDPLKDFIAIALTSYVPHCLMVANKTEMKSIADARERSKKAPLNIATSGVGSASHMTLERFKAATGIALTHVPYRSGGAMMPDVISGNVDGAMTEFSTAMSLHKEGKARIVAVAGATRSKLAPDIPTFIEAGVKDFTAQSYVGIVAPAKTPPDVVARLSAAVAAGLKAGSPSAEKLVAMGSDLASPAQMTSAGFAAFIAKDYAEMKAAAALAGIGKK